jgi:hypothetical protein
MSSAQSMLLKLDVASSGAARSLGQGESHTLTSSQRVGCSLELATAWQLANAFYIQSPRLQNVPIAAIPETLLCAWLPPNICD